MIETTETIVLKSMKYGDTSKIVTVFTKDFGKIALIAKGSRKPKNKFGSSLEPMSVSKIHFYHKQGRDLQIVSNSDTLISVNKIYDSISKMNAGLLIVEAAAKAIEKEEVNVQLFELVKQLLIRLNESKENEINLAIYFQVKLCEMMGFNIDFSRITDSNNSNYYFSFTSGQFEFAKKEQLVFHEFENEIARKLKLLVESEEDINLNIQFNRNEILKIFDFFQRYLAYHLDRNFKYKTLMLL